MKKIKIEDLTSIKDDDYIWYACYGSNINDNRLMIYINGDKDKKFANSDGCKDKSKPIDSRPYIIRRKIYFAKHSEKWNGGVAFLNYRSRGLTYGKIYKIKKSQFLDILKQEQNLKAYDTVIYIGKYKRIPIFTFTTLLKLNELKQPSTEYLNVIKLGLQQTYKQLPTKKINKYLAKISQQHV